MTTISRVAEHVFPLIPTVVDFKRWEDTEVDRYNRTIVSAIAVAMFILNTGNVTTLMDQVIRGHRLLVMSTSTTDTALSALLHILDSNNALYSFGDIKRDNRGGIENTTITFGNYSDLLHEVGISVPDSAISQDHYMANLTMDMAPLILNLLFAAWNSKDVDKDVIRYFADRLGDGEVRGNHLLVVQNFVYGLTKLGIQ